MDLLDHIRKSLEFAEQSNYSGVTVRKSALRLLIDHWDRTHVVDHVVNQEFED